MISANTIKYLTQWLIAAMESTYAAERSKNKSSKLRGLGKYDKRCWASRKLILGELIEKVVCRSDTKLFLSDKSGQTIYVFNGRYYEAIVDKANMFMKELLKRVLRGLDIGTWYINKCAEDISKECIECIMSSDEYLYTPNRRYIAFTNGIFDLKDGKLRDFNIQYQPYLALDIEYKDAQQCYKDGAETFGISDNPCRLWDTKLGNMKEGIIPNKDFREAFQMFCGSLLLDRDQIKVEYVCYLIGPGSNGKSVLASAISGVFGEHYFSRFTPKQLFKDSDARVNIAALVGKIANLVGDLDEKDMSGGDFKRFASGERFQGRKNYKEPILVQAPPLLCCTNAMPETSDDSWGHHRRQLPIYTTRRQWTEEDKDPYLTQKLTTPEARQYIFTWIYEGYKKIIRNGGNIILGEDVLKAQIELQDDSNSARRWWRDSGYFVVIHPEEKDLRWKSLKQLYAEYTKYATDSGYSTIKKRSEISAMIRSKGYSIEQGNEKRASGGFFFCIGQTSDCETIE